MDSLHNCIPKRKQLETSSKTSQAPNNRRPVGSLPINMKRNNSPVADVIELLDDGEEKDDNHINNSSG